MEQLIVVKSKEALDDTLETVGLPYVREARSEKSGSRFPFLPILGRMIIECLFVYPASSMMRSRNACNSAALKSVSDIEVGLLADHVFNMNIRYNR